MTSDPVGFYGATAQTIPVLLLVLAVETTFLARAAQSNAVRRSLESWADSGKLFMTGLILGGPAVTAVLTALLRPLIKALAQPIGRLANAAFVIGTLSLSLTAELLAFVGLATEPGSTFIAWSVWITLATIFLLVLETLWALGRVAVVGAYGHSQPPPQSDDGI